MHTSKREGDKQNTGAQVWQTRDEQGGDEEQKCLNQHWWAIKELTTGRALEGANWEGATDKKGTRRWTWGFGVLKGLCRTSGWTWGSQRSFPTLVIPWFCDLEARRDHPAGVRVCCSHWGSGSWAGEIPEILGLAGDVRPYIMFLTQTIAYGRVIGFT